MKGKIEKGFLFIARAVFLLLLSPSLLKYLLTKNYSTFIGVILIIIVVFLYYGLISFLYKLILKKNDDILSNN